MLTFKGICVLIIHHKMPYINERKDVIYYENKSDNNKYIYDKNEEDVNDVTVSDIAKLIQPGDLLAYTGPDTGGHALMAYDTVDRDGNGEVDDVLILHSIMENHIPTKITNTILEIKIILFLLFIFRHPFYN